MSPGIARLEEARLALQAALDRAKSRSERNRLGQFATPAGLAREMLRHALGLLDPGEPLRFLDPAVGTGCFYVALRAVAPRKRVTAALGFEMDPEVGTAAQRLWRSAGLALRVADFTRADPETPFNLMVCNPPYVRHHHLTADDKARLQLRTRQASGMRLGGLAGLYCHFMGLAHPWLAERGIAAWLVPSEFMDVRYGRALKRYLLSRVTLLRIHRFDPRDVQFADALVSSAVLWFRSSPPPRGHHVRFTFGGSLLAPRLTREVPSRALAVEEKWTRFPADKVRRRSAAPRLSSFFRIQRGIATGDNGYFVLPERKVAELGLPRRMLTPMLPGPRHLPDDEVKARGDGTPDIGRRLFLLDVALGEQEIAARYPQLAAYLAHGRACGVHARYLCSHRAPWYRQERRPAAPIVCTYLGRAGGKRKGAFRFILNGSRATVSNVYLAMYPTARLAGALADDASALREVWLLLRGLAPERLLGEGRVYGGGLHKLEPRELANLAVPELGAWLAARSRA
jgi:adenine-specific DNA-methyltransferase